MNENRIRQVLEIEKQAQAVYESAVREAEQLPARTEREATALIEKAQADAREEAHRMVEEAQAKEECARIMAGAEEENRRMESLAGGNIDRAVGYILDRIAGEGGD
jgi:vacuolar-type H+-ATPase subunit H